MIPPRAGLNLREVKTVHADRHHLHEEVWQLLLSADPRREIVERYLSEEYTRLGFHNNHYVAVYVLNRSTPTCFELNNIAVDAAYQGIGLGRRMLGHAIGLAEARGAREIVLSTMDSKLPHRGFFQRMGFRSVEPERIRSGENPQWKLALEPE